jgi:hypothetical protein
MKPHILSDLHTEFADFEPPETDAETIILAGDIGALAEWTLIADTAERCCG